MPRPVELAKQNDSQPREMPSKQHQNTLTQAIGLNLKPMKHAMKTPIKTDRLLLREMRASDVEKMFELDSDPEVVQYTGDPPITHRDQARQRIENIRQQYQDFGIGRWAAVLQASNEFIGWVGLKYIAQLNGRQNNYDLGYRLLRKHWGQGYATESAQAVIRYGFGKMQLPCISAYADVEHAASIHILEKCGLQFTNTFVDEGSLCAWYEMVNPAKP